MENDANSPESAELVSARCHTVVCELLFWLWPEDACGSLSEQHEHHRLLSKVVRETASYILWTPAVLHLYRHAQRHLYEVQDGRLPLGMYSCLDLSSPR